MPLTEKETSFFIPLDIPSRDEDGNKISLRDVKAEIGEYVVESMLDYLSGGQSPVAGVRAFKKLSKDYAGREKEGDSLPNLDLNGDMLDALTFKAVAGGIKVGIFRDSEAVKSFAHNTGYAGHPWLANPKLKRQFIPDESENQSLKKEILRGIDTLIDEAIHD